MDTVYGNSAVYISGGLGCGVGFAELYSGFLLYPYWTISDSPDSYNEKDYMAII
jgi:hypothetical protein